MGIQLYDHQKSAIENLKTGSILQGGVGSGKTLTALAYYSAKVKTKNIYVITTARKRDSKDWEREASSLLISNLVVDSWNNISKYSKIKNSFFIFDEQRLIGSGTWVKNFLRIVQSNDWILLSATPGDTWLDYIPVFIANGFYRNRSEFIQRHVVYKRFSKFPMVDHYVEVARLIRLRDSIIVPMRFQRQTISHNENIICNFDNHKFNKIKIGRWDIFKDEPIRDVSQLCYALRKVVNSDSDRLEKLYDIFKKHNKVILFYNFNYELAILEKFCDERKIIFRQWNGHKHEEIPNNKFWIYFVQYAAGSEAWNCIDTNCIVFYSQNYSYKVMIQAAGRIDRINTKFIDLFYYHFYSKSQIDLAIRKALHEKKNFNESTYAKF